MSGHIRIGYTFVSGCQCTSVSYFSVIIHEGSSVAAKWTGISYTKDANW